MATFSLSQTHFRPPLSSSSSSAHISSNHTPRFLSPLLLNPIKHPLTLSLSYSSPPPPPTTYTDDDDSDFSDTTLSEDEEQPDTNSQNPFPKTASSSATVGFPPPLLKKRKRYRKEYPGESKGITEEMRFVAMKFKNDKGSMRFGADSQPLDVDGEDEGSWEPTLDGFLKYLVDSKLVFHTIERIVEDSNDVSYAYVRRTGLERSGSLSRDLEWFGQQNLSIPEASNPGVSYAAYLKELSERSAPLFLCHFYNIYFSHIAGGQVIAKQVAEKLIPEKELEFYNWERDAQVLLKDIREKLNTLGEHWSRDDKNKCLKEATKSFRYMGQIVRLIIL